MPAVTITMLARGAEVRRRIARRVTEVIAEEAGVHPEWITIHFVETSGDMLAKGGVLLSERQDKSAEQGVKNLAPRV
ncbi:MAG: tautomerase family protein [Bacillota bacterium]